jgi:hypothetical protein
MKSQNILFSISTGGDGYGDDDNNTDDSDDDDIEKSKQEVHAKTQRIRRYKKGKTSSSKIKCSKKTQNICTGTRVRKL